MAVLMVNVDSLSFGDPRLSHGDTPVLDGPMLADEHGLLGVDGMAGRLLPEVSYVPDVQCW
jgi:hypothetical protein